MKKLMIAAAIACASAFSQAATCYWNVLTAGSPNKKYIYQDASNKYSGDVYVFKYITGEMTQDTVLKAVIEGSSLQSLCNTALASDGSKVGMVSAASGVISSTQVTTIGSGDEGAASGKSSFFLAVKNGEKLLLTDVVEGTEVAMTSGTKLTYGNDAQVASKTDTVFANGATFAGEGGKGAGWYSTAAVPEPTSGLLLLLGVAGLAIRRRRA